MSTADTESKFKFMVHEYDGLSIIDELQAHIDAGHLPFDTLMRIATIPSEATDDEGKYRLAWVLMHDIAQHAERPEKMRPDSRNILTRDLPGAFVDSNGRYNKEAYAQLDLMYYRMANLAQAIRDRRKDEGIQVPLMPGMHEINRNEYEWKASLGLARPVWRVLVARALPSVIEKPKLHYPSSYIGSFANIYHLGDRSVARLAIAHTVIRDDVMMQLYEESVQTGIRGIGEKGRYDIRMMLSEEHPELGAL